MGQGLLQCLCGQLEGNNATEPALSRIAEAYSNARLDPKYCARSTLLVIMQHSTYC